MDHSHPEFLRRYELARNYLNSSTELYIGSIYNLYTIPQENFTGWLFLGFTKKIEVMQLIREHESLEKVYKNFKRANRPAIRFHRRYLIIVLNYLVLMEQILKLTAFLGGKWPDELATLNGNDLSNFSAIFATLANYKKEYLQIMEQYETNLKQGKYDRNINLKEQPIAEIVEIHLSIAPLQVTSVELLTKLLVDGETSAIQQLEQHVEKIFDFLDDMSNDLLNPKFVEQPRIDYFSKWFLYFMAAVAILSLKTNDMAYLTKFEEKIGMMLDDKNKKRNPHFFVYYFKVKLALAIRDNRPSEITTYAQRLINQAENIMFQPRDKFDVQLLGHLALYSLGEEKAEKVIPALDDAFNEVKGNLGANLVLEIEDYLSIIKKDITTDEKITYSSKRASYLNPFDIHSLFIPDFSELAKENGQKELVYLPFNLDYDKVD